MRIIDGAGKFTRADGPTHWVEQLRVPNLSVGTYSIPAGSVDDQAPHTEDEIYVVTAGTQFPTQLRHQVDHFAGSAPGVHSGDRSRCRTNLPLRLRYTRNISSRVLVERPHSPSRTPENLTFRPAPAPTRTMISS